MWAVLAQEFVPAGFITFEEDTVAFYHFTLIVFSLASLKELFLVASISSELIIGFRLHVKLKA